MPVTQVIHKYRENLLLDSLRYLEPEWVNDPVLARGVITGIVSAVMATTGKDFEDTIAYLAALCRANNLIVDLSRLPEPWRDEWKKNDSRSAKAGKRASE